MRGDLVVFLILFPMIGFLVLLRPGRMAIQDEPGGHPARRSRVGWVILICGLLGLLDIVLMAPDLLAWPLMPLTWDGVVGLGGLCLHMASCLYLLLAGMQRIRNRSKGGPPHGGLMFRFTCALLAIIAVGLFLYHGKWVMSYALIREMPGNQGVRELVEEMNFHAGHTIACLIIIVASLVFAVLPSRNQPQASG